mmetsp:Transcript_864/g.2790  ORF Transcript_864/g.2790 Transcript_864/m.2790 type:complete len:308 (-) Transcript_864:311-1234(-)
MPWHFCQRRSEPSYCRQDTGQLPPPSLCQCLLPSCCPPPLACPARWIQARRWQHRAPRFAACPIATNRQASVLRTARATWVHGSVNTQGAPSAPRVPPSTALLMAEAVVAPIQGAPEARETSSSVRLTEAGSAAACQTATSPPSVDRPCARPTGAAADVSTTAAASLPSPPLASASGMVEAASAVSKAARKWLPAAHCTALPTGGACAANWKAATRPPWAASNCAACIREPRCRSAANPRLPWSPRHRQSPPSRHILPMLSSLTLAPYPLLVSAPLLQWSSRATPPPELTSALIFWPRPPRMANVAE